MQKVQNEMRHWSYSVAWQYFIAKRNFVSEDALWYMRHVAKHSRVKDCRNSGKFPNEFYFGNSLIVIDGPNCSGKSIIARKILAKYPDTIAVIDINDLCRYKLQQDLKNCDSKLDEVILSSSYETFCNDFLKANLEVLTERASEKGKKSVILVGSFLEIVHRSLIGMTLGKFFKNVVFVTVHESFDTIMEYYKSKNSIDNVDENSDEVETIALQRNFIDMVLKKRKKHFGYGADKSYIINSKTLLF